MYKTVFVAAVATSIGVAANASGMNFFTDFVGVGDSLSDKGRVPGALVAPPSNNGRFTDDRTWMEIVGAAFEKRGGQNHNMALGGATAGPTNTNLPLYQQADAFVGPRDPNNPDDISLVDLASLDGQISAFFSAGFDTSVGHNPVVAIFIGGNDIQQSDATTPLEIANLIDTITDDVITGISTFYTTNAVFDSFLLAGLPSFNISPSGSMADPLVQAALDELVGVFNSTLIAKANFLSGILPVEIEYLDMFEAFNAAVADGILAGLIPDEPCLPDLTPVNPADGFDPTINKCLVPGTSDGYLFADAIHPNSFIHNSVGHTILGQISAKLAPIPLPAAFPVFLAGLGGLVLLRKRKV